MLCLLQHIDEMMHVHGTQMMQAVTLVLEGDHPMIAKEQGLCVLTNIANGGVTSKSYIMSNEDILRKIIAYMVIVISSHVM